MIKHSRQREAIMEYLSSTDEHPTADKICMAVREKYPNISLGTVYRNLALLSERGEILHLSCGDGSDKYDGNTNPHYHFVCKNCKRVYDVPMNVITSINDLAQQFIPHHIDEHQTFFYGICNSCKDEKNS
ncbi:Peroxide stress regulator PerR, FUR family [Lachnospiraceae bacterium TWA4]|nr:Peroxide stress regulator PerR, FUR family [Lachnospiraceae bacterium TWA4]